MLRVAAGRAPALCAFWLMYMHGLAAPSVGLGLDLPAGRLRQPVLWGHGSGGCGVAGALLLGGVARCRFAAGGFNLPVAACAGGGAGVESGFSGAPVGGGGCTVGGVLAFSPCLGGWCGCVPRLWACFFPFRVVRLLDRVRPTVNVPCLGAVVCFGVPEAGSDPRGHLGVTWGVYLCAGKPPLADIILSHPPDFTRCDSVIGLAIPAMSGHIQNRGTASRDLYIGISGINRVLLS